MTENDRWDTFVRIDGAMITGPLEKVKAILETYISAKAAAGGGAIFITQSDNITKWLDDLMRKHPTTIIQTIDVPPFDPEDDEP